MTYLVLAIPVSGSIVTGQVIVTNLLFHGKKEYSVKSMDGKVVNFTEYSFFP